MAIRLRAQLLCFLAIALTATKSESQVTAASCSSTDVQAAINSATTGQTVAIPACPSGASWASGVTINKYINIQGAGSGRIVAVSSSTLSMGAGSKTLTVTGADPGNALSLTLGQAVNITETNNRSNSLSGTVTSYNASSGSLVMNVTSTTGNCALKVYPASPTVNCSRWLVSTIPSTVLVNNSSSALFSVTESSTGDINLSGFKIAQGSGSGDGVDFNAASNGLAIVLHDCWIEQGSGVSVHTADNKGLVYNCSFDSSPFSMAPIAFQLQPFDQTAWNGPSYFGMNDTNGQHNFYIEDSDFHAYLNATDNDEGARTVFRYNMLDNAGFGTHGADTGPIGQRYFELYNNVGMFEGYNNLTTFPMNWWMFVRGGTFVVHDNKLPALSSTDFGTKSDINMTVMNLQRSAGPNPCWGSGTSGGKDYPAPHQVGMGYLSGSAKDGIGRTSYSITSYGYSTAQYVGDLEPAYIWANSRQPLSNVGDSDYGTGNTDSCGGATDTTSNYVVLGRDYFNGSTAKPGYTPYTYPHPLHVNQSSTLPTSDPTPPANLQGIAR
jgi:hypothetical protein